MIECWSDINWMWLEKVVGDAVKEVDGSCGCDEFLDIQH